MQLSPVLCCMPNPHPSPTFSKPPLNLSKPPLNLSRPPLNLSKPSLNLSKLSPNLSKLNPSCSPNHSPSILISPTLSNHPKALMRPSLLLRLLLLHNQSLRNRTHIQCCYS